MKRILVLFLASLVFVAMAYGGTIIVSGDSNLGNGIDGSADATIADNGQFFSNLLGLGTSVAFRKTTNGDTVTEITSQNAILNYYGGLPGVTVNAFDAPVTAGLLSGVNLFIGFLPDVAFDAAETSAISGFLAGGGTVLLTGEWAGFDPGSDTNINALLAALGSSLSLNLTSLDTGFHVASGAQIATDPYTAGVARFSYAATTTVNGGTPLFFTLDGSPFMAYETSETGVPEPATWLLLLGGAGLLLLRRRA